jgi:hypothetical protein
MVAIFDEHEAHYTEKGVKSVVATMKLQIPPTGEQPADCIGFSNGIYDLKAQEFRPHAPDNWLMNHNGIEYTPAERGRPLQPMRRISPAGLITPPEGMATEPRGLRRRCLWFWLAVMTGSYL